MSAAPRLAAGRPGTLAGTAGAALLGLVACGAGAGLPATVPG